MPHRRFARRRNTLARSSSIAVAALLFLCVGVTGSLAVSQDTTPPTVSLTSPADGSRVVGRVAVTATAGDDVGVTLVQFRLDGSNLGSGDRLPPYQVDLDSTLLTDGPHVLGAVARDKAGNRGLASPVTINVDNNAADGGPVSVTVDGPMETVYDNDTESCFKTDYADQPVRAFRLADDRVMLYGGSGGSGKFERTQQYPNRKHVVVPFYGPDLNHLDASRAGRCVNQPVFYSNQDSSNPSQFNDRQWLGGGYTEDGTTIYALVHHEFHGNDITKYPFCFDSLGQLIERKCWYTSINFAVSTDGGHSFTQPAPPGQLVAPAPMKWEVTCNAAIQDQCGKIGYSDPSNIIKKDGYYYAFIQAIRLGSQDEGNATNCLIRTQNLADPTSWRAFDGFDEQGNPTFNMSFVNPYFSSDPPDAHRCRSVDYPNIERMSNSITYNTYLNKYLLIGYSVPRGKDSDGFYYSVSDDLVHWSLEQKIAGLPPSDQAYELSCQPANVDPVFYPSLLDPTSSSRSFETSADRPYLYFTLTHYIHNPDGSCGGSVPDRDIVRFPLEISFNTP
jgi:hypothetical protein